MHGFQLTVCSSRKEYQSTKSGGMNASFLFQMKSQKTRWIILKAQTLKKMNSQWCDWYVTTKENIFFLHQSKITFFFTLIQNYIYFFNPELQRNPHVPRGGRFLYVHWNGKDDGRILAELHACQTNRPRRRLPRVRLGLLWWKRFQVSLRFLCGFFNNRNQSTESTGTPKCEIHVRGKHVNYTGSTDMYMWIV